MEDFSIEEESSPIIEKCSSDGKITVFLDKRDFTDRIELIDAINGVLMVDPKDVEDLKVFAEVQAFFHYEQDEKMDVLRFTYQKDLHTLTEQIFPRLETSPKKRLTALQKDLLFELGFNAFPFTLEVPLYWPVSVSLHPRFDAPPCGVEYAVQAFVAKTADDTPLPESSVVLGIWKMPYDPDRPRRLKSNVFETPWGLLSVEVCKEFSFSRRKLYLEVSLDKELHQKGEPVEISILVTNLSNRTVKKIKVTVYQLSYTAQHKCIVAKIKTNEGCPVMPGSTLSKVCVLTPLIVNSEENGALLLDGRSNREVANLTSSPEEFDAAATENVGIIVQYQVKVKLRLGLMGGHLSAELPFVLIHPKSEEGPPSTNPVREHGSSQSDYVGELLG